MAYVRKTRDVWCIMTNYGYGWECECEEYTWKDAVQRLKECRERTKARVHIEKRRERIAQDAEECLNSRTIIEKDG